MAKQVNYRKENLEIDLLLFLEDTEKYEENVENEGKSGSKFSPSPSNEF